MSVKKGASVQLGSAKDSGSPSSPERNKTFRAVQMTVEEAPVVVPGASTLTFRCRTRKPLALIFAVFSFTRLPLSPPRRLGGPKPGDYYFKYFIFRVCGEPRALGPLLRWSLRASPTDLGLASCGTSYSDNQFHVSGACLPLLSPFRCMTHLF